MADTGRLRRRGFMLEYASMAWMTAEATVAVKAAARLDDALAWLRAHADGPGEQD